jgi:type VI secretion system protein ImpF
MPATPKANDRLQPALLDRLTDDDPASQVEAVEMRVLSRSRLRAAILRDLGNLFNSTSLSDNDDFDGFPEAARSVLNYGLPALSGRTASSLDPLALEESVRRCIVDFEPRILAESLRVEAVASERQMDHHNQIGFRISGQLWAQPVPLQLLLHTDIDLETGWVEIKDLTQ